MVIIILNFLIPIVIECQEVLVDPENGAVAFNSITFQSEAMYSCNTGYDLEGSSTAVCQSNAMWSNGPPFCDSKSRSIYSRLSLIRSPLGPCSLAGIAKWPDFRK